MECVFYAHLDMPSGNIAILITRKSSLLFSRFLFEQHFKELKIFNAKMKSTYIYIQYNLNGSNTDGSFTMDDSNSFFSPDKILPIAQENKYLGIFSYYIM